MQVCKTVTLRQREKRNGILSFYLDFYPGYRDLETMRLHRRKALGIYIYKNPKNSREKQHNIIMTEKAEAIRGRIYEEVINERYDFFSHGRMKENFLTFYESVAKKKNAKWMFVYKHFCKFVNNSCTNEEVTLELCQKFREYLLSAHNLRNNRAMAQNSSAGYWSCFRAMLKVAYKSQKIKVNINDYLDRISTRQKIRPSLTLEEIRTLWNTPCEIDVLRRASIFSCLTGIRRSDLIKMEWSNIRSYNDGGHYVQFISQKTGAYNTIPINDEAMSILPEKVSDQVFPGFKAEMTSHPLKRWLAKAGIDKGITFHCFRHTFATLQVELGTDIYTVQHLLAHRNVSTTQIYAHHSESKKREAASKISLIDVNDKDQL